MLSAISLNLVQSKILSSGNGLNFIYMNNFDLTGQWKKQSEAGQGGRKNKFKKPRSDLKRPEQIMKQRKVKAKQQALQFQRKKMHSKNRAISKQKEKKAGRS